MKLPWTPEVFEGALLADGFASAFIGFTFMPGEEDSRAVYSVNRILDELVKNHGMSKDDAVEYYEFNILGAVMGNRTPIYVEEFTAKEIKHG